MIDVIVLSQQHSYASVGQQHKVRSMGSYRGVIAFVISVKAYTILFIHELNIIRVGIGWMAANERIRLLGLSFLQSFRHG